MYSDFDSDLTELSSSEDSYAPSRKSKEKKEYTIRNALRPPRNTQYTVKSLYDQIIENSIDLNPEYQRDVVWPETKQIGLIDSVLRNYYIPPIIFAVTSYTDGTETRVCIDGKQRLTSIQRFLDGVIPHRDSVTGKRYWTKQGGVPARLLLPRQYAQQFANKQITCMEYDTLTQDQEREIFQRVQLGVALTPAERMQAITGPWPTLIREIQAQILGEDGFGEDLDWGHTRGRDFQCLAAILMLITKYPTSVLPGAAQVEKWLAETEPIPVELRSEIPNTFKIFVNLVRDRRYNGAFQQPTRVSPIEFTMIGVLIHFSRTKWSMSQLSSAISKMRAHVREHHVDIRSNSKVMKTMLEFINETLEILDISDHDEVMAPAVTQSSRKPQKQLKRKRLVPDSSDSEEDNNPQPPRKTTARTARTITKVTPTPAKPTAAKSTSKATPKRLSAKSAGVVSVPPMKTVSPKRASITQLPSTKGPLKVTSRSMTTAKSASQSIPNGSNTIAKPDHSSITNNKPDLVASKPAIPRLSQSEPQPAADAATLIKQESGSENNVGQNCPPSNAGHVDRLASVRAARQTSNSTPRESPDVPNDPRLPPSRQHNGVIQPPSAENMSTRSADPRPPPLNMSVHNAVQAPPTGISPTGPPVIVGRKIDKASIETILARHGVGPRPLAAQVHPLQQPTPSGGSATSNIPVVPLSQQTSDVYSHARQASQNSPHLPQSSQNSSQQISHVHGQAGLQAYISKSQTLPQISGQSGMQASPASPVTPLNGSHMTQMPRSAPPASHTQQTVHNSPNLSINPVFYPPPGVNSPRQSFFAPQTAQPIAQPNSSSVPSTGPSPYVAPTQQFVSPVNMPDGQTRQQPSRFDIRNNSSSTTTFSVRPNDPQPAPTQRSHFDNSNTPPRVRSASPASPNVNHPLDRRPPLAPRGHYADRNWGYDRDKDQGRGRGRGFNRDRERSFSGPDRRTGWPHRGRPYSRERDWERR